MAQIETLMLANHAESVNGLLYVHGGGWSHHWRPPLAADNPPSQFAVAATFLLEPAEARTETAFTFAIVDASGNEVMRADGNLAANPGAPSGPQLRTSVALNAAMAFPVEGAYTLSAEISGAAGKSLLFWVHDQPPPDGTELSTEPPGAGTGGYL